MSASLLLLGERAAAADTLALLLGDSKVDFLTPASAAVDPFWLKLKGVRSFDDVVAGR